MAIMGALVFHKHCLFLPAMRGYMNARGLPDCPRSSRYVLKDYVNVSERSKAIYASPDNFVVL